MSLCSLPQPAGSSHARGAIKRALCICITNQAVLCVYRGYIKFKATGAQCGALAKCLRKSRALRRCGTGRGRSSCLPHFPETRCIRGRARSAPQHHIMGATTQPLQPPVCMQGSSWQASRIANKAAAGRNASAATLRQSQGWLIDVLTKNDDYNNAARAPLPSSAGWFRSRTHTARRSARRRANRPHTHRRRDAAVGRSQCEATQKPTRGAWGASPTHARHRHYQMNMQGHARQTSKA